jgi:polysaccharide deacetylase 2 family uncharacterized protein YibQ
MSIAVGQAWQQQRESRPQMLIIAWFATFAAFLLFLASIAVFGRAGDGEPSASIDVSWPPLSVAKSRPPQHAALAAPRQAPAVPAASPAVPPVAVAPPNAPAAPPAAAQAPGVPGKIDKPIYAGTALIADPALLEETDQGPIPRIAADGRKPMAVYAPPVAADHATKLAIIVTGLGLSAKATSAALDALPSGVTLAFAPYADDVQNWTTQARSKGHEVLLEVPMEPYDFPDSDPGPHTLRVAASEESNTTRLVWSLSRFTGYAGVTNLLGERFLADPDALAPMLTYLTRRGLLFFDGSSSEHSVAPDVARQAGATYLHSAVTIDAIESAMEIDARLSDVETRARTEGAAAGTGFAYPVTISRIANWARGLPGRGFVLVPASAIVGVAK